VRRNEKYVNVRIDKNVNVRIDKNVNVRIDKNVNVRTDKNSNVRTHLPRNEPISRKLRCWQRNGTFLLKGYCQWRNCKGTM